MKKRWIILGSFIIAANSMALTSGTEVATGTTETVTSEESVAINDKTVIKGTVVNDGSINIIEKDGLNIDGGVLTNNGEISTLVSEGSGISFGTSGGTFTNDGSLTVSSSTGVLLSKGATFNNSKNGVIDILGGVGVELGETYDGTFANEGKFDIISGTGIQVNSTSNGSVDNKGTISLSSGIGIDVQGGANVTNSGNIVVEGGVGINVGAGSSATIKNTGKASVDRLGASFIYNESSKATVENAGDVTITGGGTGIYTVAGDKTSNKGDLIIEDGLGIFAQNMEDNEDSADVNESDANVSASNDGTIKVGEDSTALAAEALVDTKGIVTVTNNGEVIIDNVEGAIGVSADYTNAVAVNSKDASINISGEEVAATGMAANFGGSATNDGTINVSGIASTGMLANSGTEKDGISTVKNTGTINAKDNAVAMQIVGNYKDKSTSNETLGIGYNSGTINFEGVKDPVYGDVSAAVFLDGGLLINDGAINSNGIAIISASGDRNGAILKPGTAIKGDILGNGGTDVLLLEGLEQSGLNVEYYEGLGAAGTSSVADSTIKLFQSDKTSALVDEMLGETSATGGELSITDSKIQIQTDGSGSDVLFGDTLNLNGEVTFTFLGNQSQYRLSDYFEGTTINIDPNGKFDTANALVWNSTIVENDIIFDKEAYNTLITDQRLLEFSTMLDTNLGEVKLGGLADVIAGLDYSQTKEEFTKNLMQISGSMYSYLPELNLSMANDTKESVVNTLRNRIINEHDTKGDIEQDVIYLNSETEFGGLIDTKLEFTGLLGMTTKRINNSSTIGIFYGGGHGNASFDDKYYGNGSINTLQAGAFYTKSFGNKVNLITNLGFALNDSKLERNVTTATVPYKLAAQTSTKLYQFGLELNKEFEFGNFSFTPYLGGDVTQMNIGNITEEDKTEENLNYASQMLINTDKQNYLSTTGKIGTSFAYTGERNYKFYKLGLDMFAEQEFGDIETKTLKMNNFGTSYDIKNMESTGVSFNVAANAEIDITEELTLNVGYLFNTSKEITSNIYTAGFKYTFNK